MLQIARSYDKNCDTVMQMTEVLETLKLWCRRVEDVAEQICIINI